jgi:hypothetical protein
MQEKFWSFLRLIFTMYPVFKLMYHVILMIWEKIDWDAVLTLIAKVIEEKECMPRDGAFINS